VIGSDRGLLGGTVTQYQLEKPASRPRFEPRTAAHWPGDLAVHFLDYVHFVHIKNQKHNISRYVTALSTHSKGVP
jgi:hypothetical protein